MQKGIWPWRPMEKLCALLLLALALSHGAFALSEPKAIDVLPGAFGEAIDTLDEATAEKCVKCADRALRSLLEDFGRIAEQTPESGYLQILQTTLFLPESQPTDATDIERTIWAEIYAGAECVVSFVAIDDSMNLGGALYAEQTGRYDAYAVRRDGSVQGVSLRQIRSRFFADPVLPGVRVINMGSHYNAIYTFPVAGENRAKSLFEYLDGPALTAFAENFEADFPVSVSVRHDGEAGGTPVTVADPETIRAVFDALGQITVLGEWSAGGCMDDYLHYYFGLADGSSVYVCEFQDGMLLDQNLGLHVISGFDALQRALPDPGL